MSENIGQIWLNKGWGTYIKVTGLRDGYIYSDVIRRGSYADGGAHPWRMGNGVGHKCDTFIAGDVWELVTCIPKVCFRCGGRNPCHRSITVCNGCRVR